MTGISLVISLDSFELFLLMRCKGGKILFKFSEGEINAN